MENGYILLLKRGAPREGGKTSTAGWWRTPCERFSIYKLSRDNAARQKKNGGGEWQGPWLIEEWDDEPHVFEPTLTKHGIGSLQRTFRTRNEARDALERAMIAEGLLVVPLPPI